jgi:hypothetical protein
MLQCRYITSKQCKRFTLLKRSKPEYIPTASLLGCVLRGSVELPLAGVHFFPMRTTTCFFMCLNLVRARRSGPWAASPRSCPHGEEVHARKWKLYAATQDSPLEETVQGNKYYLLVVDRCFCFRGKSRVCRCY